MTTLSYTTLWDRTRLANVGTTMYRHIMQTATYDAGGQ